MPKCPICGEDSLHLTDHECHTETERRSCSAPLTGSARITVESIKKLGSELDEFLRESWIRIFEGNGFDAKDGDTCLVNKFSISLFPAIPQCFASHIIVSELVPKGTAAIFMKNYDPFKIDVSEWNKPNK